jgi:hypothetical protein
MGKQNFAIGVILSAAGLIGMLRLACAQEPYAAPPAYQPSTIDEQTLKLYREQLRLGKAELALKILEKRFELEQQHDALLDGAYIIKGMAELDVNDPNYQSKRAEILSKHVSGLDLAKDFIRQKMIFGKPNK